MVIYDKYDNSVRILVSEKVGKVKTPLDFSTAVSITLSLPDLGLNFSDEVVVDPTTGVLEFLLGDADLPVGYHRIRLVVYDIAHPDGQIILHEGKHKARIQVVETPEIV